MLVEGVIFDPINLEFDKHARFKGHRGIQVRIFTLKVHPTNHQHGRRIYLIRRNICGVGHVYRTRERIGTKNKQSEQN